MGINELVERKSGQIATVEPQSNLFNEVPSVKYYLVDSASYSFEYQVDDIEVNMFESDRTYDSDEFVDAEFEESVSEKDYSYYTIAVASGLITGLFSQL